MAVSLMKKMNLVALQSEYSDVVNLLQEIGIVQIADSTLINNADKEAEANIKTEGESAEYVYAQVVFAINFLSKYNKVKISLVDKLSGGKIEITKNKLNKVLTSFNFKKVIEKCEKLEEELNNSNNVIDKNKADITALSIWNNLDFSPKAEIETEKTKTWLGSIEKNNYSEFLVEIEKVGVVNLTKSSEDENGVYFALSFTKDLEKEVKAVLSKFDFKLSQIPDTEKKVEELEKEIKESERKIEKLTSEIKLLAGNLKKLQIISDDLLFKKEQEELVENISNTKKTFNLSFCDWPNNELKYAKCASEFFNTNHKEVTVTPDIIKLLPKVVWHMDEPVADPTAILNYVLAEKAKSSVKVILTGEGADEVFAGYEQYKIMNLTKNYSKIVPKIVQKNLIQGLVNLLPKESFFIKLSNYLSTISNTPKSYVELLSIFDKSEKKLLYSNHLIKKAGNLNSDLKLVSCYFKNSYDLLNKMLLSDIKTWLPNNMLIKLDRMSMAHSIEARVPFLDHRIVEFSSKIPSRLKLKGLNEKFILKKSMENKIPENILKRKKQRFFVPLDFWFKNNLDYITSNIFLDSDFLKKNFNKKFILRLLDYQKSSSHKTILKHNQLLRLYYPRQIWNLITLSMWHKTYIENDSTKPLNILSI